jgi:hypothetical protein
VGHDASPTIPSHSLGSLISRKKTARLVASTLSSTHSYLLQRQCHHRHKPRGTNTPREASKSGQALPRSRPTWVSRWDTRSWCSRSNWSTSSCCWGIHPLLPPLGVWCYGPQQLAGSRGRPPGQRGARLPSPSHTVVASRCILEPPPLARHLQPLPSHCLYHADDPLFSRAVRRCYAESTCYKCMFQVFQMFQRYVAGVSYRCGKSM